MKYIYCSLIFTIAANSEFLFAEDFKKIHDNITDKVVEVCSVDADGTLNIASRCVYNWIDIPIISYAADPKLKRRPTEVTEIITPVHNIFRRKDAVYAVFQHSLVEISYGMADGKSSITIFQPSGETLQKYTQDSTWLAKTSSLGTEVDEVDGYKKGDKFCLRQSPYEGYPIGLPVKITHLFNTDHFAVVDTQSTGFLGMGYTLKFYFTALSNLMKCEDKSTLDPRNLTKISLPVNNDDVKINNQQSPKEKIDSGVATPTSTEQTGAKATTK